MKPKHIRPQGGQTLIEFAFGATLVTLAVLSGAWMFKAQWEKDQCVYWTFRAAHLRLTGTWESQRPLPNGTVQVVETPEDITANGHCGSATERVTLRKLPEIPW